MYCNIGISDGIYPMFPGFRVRRSSHFDLFQWLSSSAKFVISPTPLIHWWWLDPDCTPALINMWRKCTVNTPSDSLRLYFESQNSKLVALCNASNNIYIQYMELPLSIKFMTWIATRKMNTSGNVAFALCPKNHFWKLGELQQNFSLNTYGKLHINLKKIPKWSKRKDCFHLSLKRLKKKWDQGIFTNDKKLFHIYRLENIKYCKMFSKLCKTQNNEILICCLLQLKNIAFILWARLIKTLPKY